jgi:hypothetical protein
MPAYFRAPFLQVPASEFMRPRRLSSPRGPGHWALARVLRLGAAVLFGLWALAALGFCAAVAVVLIW